MYDRSHWLSLKPPSAPSVADVGIYQQLLEPGRVLLLGCTEKLLPLADHALDLDPLYDNPVIRQGDWRDNREFFDNIIGDGVFHLDENLCRDLLQMAQKHCRVFISRSFNQKLEGMRYARFFPGPEDFPLRPQEIIQQPLYTFYKWRF